MSLELLSLDFRDSNINKTTRVKLVTNTTSCKRLKTKTTIVKLLELTTELKKHHIPSIYMSLGRVLTADRQINHCNMQCTSSLMPGLQIPTKSQSIKLYR